jgi:hypothetical protein
MMILTAGAFFSAPAGSQPQIPDDWVSVPAGNILTLRAPPGTTFRTQSGIDSFTGKLEGPDFVLSLDFGAFAGPLTKLPGMSDYTLEEIRIDGKPARLVSGTMSAGSTAPHYLIGLYFAHLSDSASKRPLNFSISGTLSGADQQAVVRQIFATIHFGSS